MGRSNDNNTATISTLKSLKDDRKCKRFVSDVTNAARNIDVYQTMTKKVSGKTYERAVGTIADMIGARCASTAAAADLDSEVTVASMPSAEAQERKSDHDFDHHRLHVWLGDDVDADKMYEWADELEYLNDERTHPDPDHKLVQHLIGAFRNDAINDKITLKAESFKKKISFAAAQRKFAVWHLCAREGMQQNLTGIEVDPMVCEFDAHPVVYGYF